METSPPENSSVKCHSRPVATSWSSNVPSERRCVVSTPVGFSASFLLCMRGRCRVVVDDGEKRAEIVVGGRAG